MTLDLPLTQWSALARFLSDLGDLPPTIAAFRDELCDRLVEKPKAPPPQHPTVEASTIFGKAKSTERQRCTAKDIKTGRQCRWMAMVNKDHCGGHRPTVAVTSKAAKPAKPATTRCLHEADGIRCKRLTARPSLLCEYHEGARARQKAPRAQPVPSAFQGPPAGERPTSAPPKSDPSKPTLRSEVEKAQRFHNVRMDF